MHIAILAALIIIILILAPWLFSVALIAAAAYGLFLVAAGAIALCVFIGIIAWTILKPKKNTHEIIIVGERKSCRSCFIEIEANAVECIHCGQPQK